MFTEVEEDAFRKWYTEDAKNLYENEGFIVSIEIASVIAVFRPVIAARMEGDH